MVAHGVGVAQAKPACNTRLQRENAINTINTIYLGNRSSNCVVNNFLIHVSVSLYMPDCCNNLQLIFFFPTRKCKLCIGLS